MLGCPYVRACSFLRDTLAIMPEAADILRLRFCKNAHTACARFLVGEAQGLDGVPSDLFPTASSETLRRLGVAARRRA